MRYEHLFVSHAHADHTVGLTVKKAKKYAHPATVGIFEAVSQKPPVNVTSIDYSSSITIDDMTVTAHDSGHILGSTLFEVDTPHGTIVYTGDMNCIRTLMTAPAEKVRCDALIMEATYGRPDIQFPPRHETYKDMIEWLVNKKNDGKTPVFYVYAVGKAQEIVRTINEFTEIPVLVHPKIAKVNEVYSRRDQYLYTVEESASYEGLEFASVHPNSGAGSAGLKNEVPVVATGWASKFKYRTVAFPLSNHADYGQLLDYARAVRSKEVFTCFGYNDDLAIGIRRHLGIPARPINSVTISTKLADF